MTKATVPKGELFPEQFEDRDIFKIVTGRHNDDLPVFGAYELCCGLLIKLKAGVIRVYKRSQYKLIRTVDDYYPSQLYECVERYTFEKEQLRLHWTPEHLWETAVELTAKCTNISPEIQKEIQIQPLLPRDKVTGLLPFSREFLLKVKAYHDAVQRPEGTFSPKVSALLDTLREMPRVECPSCNERKQLYCGRCAGVRMPNAEGVLPARIEMPFDMLLLVHWQESLHKCTGVHTGALCGLGNMSHVVWERSKTDADWLRIVGGLDPSRDVLLFPSDSSVDANDFDWTSRGCSSEGGGPRKWRLIVLEGSWSYAKTMATQIIEYRERHGMAPLPCVILHNVTGQYWRFHCEGHAAVSTIEAIAHTARAAGLGEEAFEALLTLFYLQKTRVLSRVSEGGRPPKAIEVCGAGEGSWKDLTAALDEVAAEGGK